MAKVTDRASVLCDYFIGILRLLETALRSSFIKGRKNKWPEIFLLKSSVGDWS